jgi:glycine cleavage system transcriptional repressor
MTVLGGEFAAILLVEGKWNTLAKVENALPELERSLGMTIVCKRTGERERSTDKVPYAVDVIAMDHPGIVNNLAGFFAERRSTSRTWRPTPTRPPTPARRCSPCT